MYLHPKLALINPEHLWLSIHVTNEKTVKCPNPYLSITSFTFIMSQIHNKKLVSTRPSTIFCYNINRGHWKNSDDFVPACPGLSGIVWVCPEPISTGQWVRCVIAVSEKRGTHCYESNVIFCRIQLFVSGWVRDFFNTLSLFLTSFVAPFQ